jgi:DNA polymerase elongation subunit (family B)
MNPLLFGHSEDERIVAVQQQTDRTMRIYVREGEAVRSEVEPLYPFFYLSDQTLLEGFTRKHWIKKLEGTLYYQYLCAFEEWPVMWDAIRLVLERYNRTAITKVDGFADCPVLYLVTDPATQYLMQSGRTLFKGMDFEALRRMQLDIETFTPPGFRFPNSARKTDRIILIALADSTGWKHVIDGRKLSEKQMLAELVKIVNERDPDVIEGHNIFNFDLPYLTARSTIHNIPLPLGRDGSVPRVFETRTAFADHPFDYTATEIAGRHVIDTLLLLQSYDSSKRSLESYSLKYAAQHFGFAAPTRTYIPPDRISWYWENDPKTLIDYATDDVIETEKLSRHLAPTSFYLARMIPTNLGSVARMGSAAKIEQLMVREYLRIKHSLPRPQEGAQTTGGYTDIFIVGSLGPIVHADVESLYPSIMISRDIRPGTDVLQAFPKLLKDLTTMRLDAKRKSQSVNTPSSRSQMDAMQSSMKILINSFYGYLGYNRGLFNDYRKADEVTSTGQQILKQMIAYVRDTGGKVIEVDTDGIFFVPPTGVDTREQEKEFVDQLSANLPQGIVVVHDGRYRRMLSYKKKNYALLEYDNRIRIKGSSLISRSIEQFGREYIHQAVDRILNNDVAGLHALFVQYRATILEHGLDVRAFSRIESLKDPIEVYQEGVRSGRRNKSAAYEVAIASGKPFRPGDRVAYYITGTEADVRGFENCKSAEEWDPNFPDENAQYYLRRLDEFSEKFAEFFSPGDFRSIFSTDELFPFDPKGITLLIRDVGTKPSDGIDEGPTPKPGIWLDEAEM